MDVAVRLGEYDWVVRKNSEYLTNQSSYFYKTFRMHFYESYSIEDMVNFDISNALGQN
jgi:hypothetical protein